MEELKYELDDQTIVELLGVQNFTTPESAILELVKNAYDANASNLSLTFTKDDLIIDDDGMGMNEDDIKSKWMHIGKSDKEYSIVDENNNTRILAGSKGVGRFALARLGGSIEMKSKRKNSEGVLWTTNWKDINLDKYNENIKNGTRIHIRELREKWTKKKIDSLCKYLEMTYNDTSMKIFVNYDNNEIKKEIPLHFSKPELGKNCKSFIHLKYENGVLITVIDSDEFSDDAIQYCKGIDIHHYENKSKILNELKGSEIGKLLEDDIEEKLGKIGNFTSNIYFNFKANKDDKEKFLYKYIQTEEKIDGDIVLFRNAFSISSFDGTKDWLELGQRARKSPAAATHPTGSWRVRRNQVSGFVSIDKNKNEVLKDLANRQGIEENEYYRIFLEIIWVGLKEFERYRQNIIKQIDKKNQIKDLQIRLLDLFIKNELNIKKLESEKIKQLIKETKELKDLNESIKQDAEKKEDNYRYDVRILNVLATMGLKASAMAHELRNDRNTLISWYDYTVNALKTYGMWDELNKSDKTIFKHKNVPKLLKSCNDSSKKMLLFINTMLEENAYTYI